MNRPVRRAGVSLVEALVAVTILAVTMGALMSLSTQQPRAVALDEGRQLATMLLQELQAAFGKRTYADISSRGFPAPPGEGGAETFDQTYYTILQDHPLITLPGLPDDSPAAQQVLVQRLEAADVWRAVYVEEDEGPGGKGRLLVTYRVYYELRGQRRHVEAFEVLTER